MTANASGHASSPRQFGLDWRPIAAQSIALLVALWFLTKVVPVFIAVQSSLGLETPVATIINQLSQLATFCGIALLPVCFVGRIIAVFGARPGDCNAVQRSWQMAFERTLCVVVTVPLLTFLIALLTLWIPRLR